MKNKDSAAFPITLKYLSQDGLTKRERLAMDLFTHNVDLTCDERFINDFARRAINAADIFFAELSQDKGEE